METMFILYNAETVRHHAESKITVALTGQNLKKNMTQMEILEGLKKLTNTERLTIIEAALHLIREDLQQVEQPLARTERRQQLAAAAEAILPDYAAGGELTIFTVLDSEDFHG
jgi:hypothetical protein